MCDLVNYMRTLSECRPCLVPVSLLPEVLWQAGEVPGVSPPVGAEVVEPRGVGPP